MKKNTITAIEKHIANGETRFYIGAYYYEVNVNGMIRRREQCKGRTPTSDWELVANWDASDGKYVYAD